MSVQKIKAKHAEEEGLPRNRYCRNCGALCCKDLSMAIGKPANKKEIEELKWQLQFDAIKVYIRKRRWYQLVESKCMYLSRDNRCTIYDKRPDKCREHNPPDCEYFGKFYDVIFTSPDELNRYFKREKRKRKRK